MSVAGAAATVEAISVDRVDAVWAVNDAVGESSQAIPIRAAHPGCPSWSRLGGLVIESVETDDTVTITATFPQHSASVPCNRRGTAMRATVKLDRPLGERKSSTVEVGPTRPRQSPSRSTQVTLPAAPADRSSHLP